MQEKIIEELRNELKEQIKENQELLKINEEHKKLNGELRKENDGLVTVIDLAKQKLQDWEYLSQIDCYYEPIEVIEILDKARIKGE